MAAPPPNRGGNQPGRTFLQALANRPTPLSTNLPANPEIVPKTSYKGEIACIVTRKQAETLAGHYSNALIGKFNRGKPTMEKLNEAFKSVGFRGNFQLGSIDYRHVLIRLDDKDDYQRMWLKGQWSFLGSSMKVLKWTVDFTPQTESSIVPVWVTIRNVPIYFYNETMIQCMGNQIGNFIKMDAATLGVTRPSAVKICIEVDLKKKLPSFIRVGIEDEGKEHNILKLPIEFEDIPSYCNHCQTIGHDDVVCVHLHPELKRPRHGKTDQTNKVQKGINPGFYRPILNKPLAGNEINKDVSVAKTVINVGAKEDHDGTNKNGDKGKSKEEGSGSGLSLMEKDRSFLQQKEKICVDPNTETETLIGLSSNNKEANTDPLDRNTLLSIELTPHRFNFCSKDDLWTDNKKIGRRASPDRPSFSVDGQRSNRFTPLVDPSLVREEEEQIDITSEVSAEEAEHLMLNPDPVQQISVDTDEVSTAKVRDPETNPDIVIRQESRKNNFFSQLNKIMTPRKQSSPNKIITRSSKSFSKDSQ